MSLGQTSTLCYEHPASPWLDETVRAADESPRELHPVLQEFEELIETTPRISMLFRSLFQQPQNTARDCDSKLRDYRHLLRVLNYIIARPPPWSSKGMQIGLPIGALLRGYMGTPSGFAAFLDPEVNRMIKKVLDGWGSFLQSPASTAKLDDTPDGWFNNVALANLTAAGNIGNTSYRFDELYVCDPDGPHYGFKSWDDFFTRKFRDATRPIASPDDDNIIVNPCEADPVFLQRDMASRDAFWIKGQTYSVEDMLGDYASKYIGGTFYQGFLQVYNYHRWHAPVSGKVIKTVKIPGTYFSTPGAMHTDLAADVKGRVFNFSPYNTVMATRGLILIEADNPALGTVAFLAVGMAEVSTCETTVREGDRVKKGEEIGMFHYGGSTFCMFFEQGVDIDGFPEVGSETVAVRAQLAVAAG